MRHIGLILVGDTLSLFILGPLDPARGAGVGRSMADGLAALRG